jgi:hypothetical protein
MNVLTINSDQKQALMWAIDLATDDQEHLLNYGNPALDYGAEWTDVARTKADQLRLLAAMCMQLGEDEMASGCESLARNFEAAVEEL